MRPSILAALVLLGATPALADEPVPEAPAPEAPAPEAPAPETTAPEAAAPEAAANPPPVVEPTPAATPPPTTSTAFPVGVEESATPSPAARRGNPRFALELSGLGATNANPYLQHEGWNFETGPALGARLEAQWIGISLGVEHSSMSNTKVCGVGCFTGDFGRTAMTAIDLGFRFRFHVAGVRPFVSGAFGGMRATSGGWTMSTDRAVLGGHVRATAGVEVPLPGRMFVSGQIGYRFAVTENPLRDKDKEMLDAALLGTEASSANYVEDSHQIVFAVGVGVEL